MVVLVFMVFVCLLALVGGVCGGGCWCVGIRGVCNVFFKIYAYINCNVIFIFLLFVGKTCLPKEKKVKVDQRLTTKKKGYSTEGFGGAS